MEQQFDDVFNKHHLIASAIKFEMKHRVEIPDEYMDFGHTVQTLVRKAAKLKKMALSVFCTAKSDFCIDKIRLNAL